MELRGLKIKHPTFVLVAFSGFALILSAGIMQAVGGSGWWPGMTLVFGVIVAASGGICLALLHGIRIVTKWNQRLRRPTEPSS
jgi:hypothetical protein